MQPDAQALADCCRAAINASNGHHRRWAVVRCRAALQAPGVTPAAESIDWHSARAMVSVAEVIRNCAAQWRLA